MTKPLTLFVVTAGVTQSTHSTSILVVGTLTSVAIGGYLWRRSSARITRLERRMEKIEKRRV